MPQEQLLAPFSSIHTGGRRTVIVAVSGGSDSTALLLLARRWAASAGGSVRLVAVTVDHGLRAESAAEARAVAALCGRLGVAHRILNWEGLKPSSGLAEAARFARYGLLRSAAESEGTDLVLVGHTSDDQAETVAMRLARGEGRGLAGIAPATLIDESIWALRPLLGFSRANLRHFLREHGVGWIDDPSNADFRFERPRLRQAMHSEAADRQGLLARASASAEQRQRSGEAAAELLDAHACQPSPGLLHLAPGFLQESAGPRLAAFRIVLAAWGGQPHLPDSDAAAAILARLEAGTGRATLSRCVVAVRGGSLYLWREARNLPLPAPALDGALWDGRFRIEAGAGEGWTVAPVGVAAEAATGPPVPDIPRWLVRAGLSAEPALWRAGEAAGPARLRKLTPRAVPVLGPWARFLPSFDLAPAAALARLLGVAAPPPSPFGGHNGTQA